MAGRKQHYIPQFLLRGFGWSRNKKLYHVAVYSRDRGIYTPATEGVGAARDFYSDPPGISGEKTLDDKITEYEISFSELVHRLQGADAKEAFECIEINDIANLVAHLFIRVEHLRQLFLHGMRNAFENQIGSQSPSEVMNRALELHKPLPNKLVLDVIRQAWRENSQGWKNAGFQKQSDFERRVYRTIQNERGKIIESSSDLFGHALQNIVERMPELVRASHQKALLRGLVPLPRVEMLMRLSWRLECHKDKSLILPDYVVTAIHDDGQYLPLIFSDENKIASVILPISHNRILIGEKIFIQDLIKNYNKKAAALCWDYFVGADKEIYASIRGLIRSDLQKYLLDS